MTSNGSATERLQALCNEGLALQQMGRWEEARERYKKVLGRDPSHFNGLCLMGTVCLETGQFELAVSLTRRAIASVAKGGGSVPALAAAHGNLGAALAGLERNEEALASYDKGVALLPAYGQVHANRGGLLVKLGRFDEAVVAYDRAVGLDPADGSAWFGRSFALQASGRLADAVSSYERAAALRPGDGGPHLNRGGVLLYLERFDEALSAFDAAIAFEPRLAEAHNGRGLTLFSLNRFEEALASYEAAVAAEPRFAAAHCNKGAALFILNRPEDALASYDAAIARDARDASSWFGRGAVLNALERPDEALASYDTAIALDPRHLEAPFQKGQALLRAGRLEEGWRLYEQRKKRPEWRFTPWAGLGEDRLWLGGEDLKGKHLFVHYEQGQGDTIQFVRYVSVLRAQGVTFTLSVQDSLRELVQGAFPGAPVVAEQGDPPEFDLQCPLLSLPLALGTRLETIPSQTPYLFADTERRNRFAAVLGPRTRPRIGLVWSGSPTHDNDRNRSIPFTALSPLLCEGADWVCLQKEIRSGERADVEACGRVGVHGETLNDFSDTAALVDQMDLVIAVDTSVAHLAGAMGKPVWILLPANADWRWMTGRSDTPWYPTARLFRQGRPGDWPGVIEDVRRELALTFPT